MKSSQLALLAGLVLPLAACDRTVDDGVVLSDSLESCMSCHNGAAHDDYSGTGLENPHPFPGAATLRCTRCHGGDGTTGDIQRAHVPPPPEIGDEEQLVRSREAYFNRLTLTGIDKYEDYTVDGRTYSALDYLQFINPGDLRVVTQGRSCGECHAPHVDCVVRSPLATEAGILSGALHALGIENAVPESVGQHVDTAADRAFRAVEDPGFVLGSGPVGAVGRLLEFPVFSRRGEEEPDSIFRSDAYTVDRLEDGVRDDNSVAAGSALANLYHEQVAFTCGDCHLGSAGANNRYGDYRSSGCTACHMRYSLDGRSRSSDPNIRKLEPLDPDDIDPPERPHVRRHLITSVAQTLVTGEQVEGIDDYTCAGCHQGSNRTVMQYWGIRLDQNQDLRRRVQYPANPATFRNTARDERLFDPEVGNRTFNGRNANQYILEEDYDGDGRDDTPPDVHYEAGLGCIDCHGSHDLHGGTVSSPERNAIVSRQEQAVAVRCESCHGTVDSYAETRRGATYTGEEAELAIDAEGNPLPHVVREPGGHYWLTSRLTGRRHYVRQTRDVVVEGDKTHPLTGTPLFSAKASYAMGRADGNPSTGIGPLQEDSVPGGFRHGDSLSCVACHASWTNGCVGCHLGGEYDEGNNFSNITGERIVFRQADADFVYQTPVPFQLGIDTHNRVSPISPNTSTFFRYEDRDRNLSRVFAFSDRSGGGNNPSVDGRGAHPSLSHNVMMPHSIRGRVTDESEGARSCVACHLTESGLAAFRAEYDEFRAAIRADDYRSLDFDLLREHIGQNPGNQLDSPLWVHMVAGLGSGLFLFDENGCPVNPLDDNDDRFGCDDLSPADRFPTATITFDLDRIVEETGVSNGSNNHPMLDTEPSRRDGALHPELSGPLGATLIRRLTDPDAGIVLDSWVDADGELRGGAGAFVDEP